MNELIMYILTFPTRDVQVCILIYRAIRGSFDLRPEGTPSRFTYGAYNLAIAGGCFAHGHRYYLRVSAFCRRF